MTEEAEKHISEVKQKESFCIRSGISISCPVGEMEGKNYVSEYIEGRDIGEDFYYNRDIELLTSTIRKTRQNMIAGSENKIFYPTSEFISWFGTDYLKDECFTSNSTNVDMRFSNIKNL